MQTLFGLHIFSPSRVIFISICLSFLFYSCINSPPEPLSNNNYFQKSKDTTGVFIGTEMIYSLSNIYNYNYDINTFTLELLQKPSGMILQTESSQYNSQLRWTPSTQNIGANFVRIRLLDSSGYADTLALCVYVTAPSLTLGYSISHYSSGDWTTSESGVSTMTIGAIDSSKTTPKYLIKIFDTSSVFPPMPTPTSSKLDLFYYSCSLDSAFVHLWTAKYPLLSKPGTLKKAVINGDTAAVKTVIDSNVVNSMCYSKTNDTASFSESIGLISYDMNGSSGPGDPCHGSWDEHRNLNQINGKPLQIEYLQ